jgi:hypothetical protein
MVFILNYNHASILYLVSSIIIVVGLPLGFYLVFCTLDVIDHMKYASIDIGEGFMKGLENGINQTLLNQLAKQITHTVVISAMIYRIPPPPPPPPPPNQI